MPNDARKVKDELRAAVEGLHSCAADFVRRVEVHETFQGQTVWAGEVSEYRLTGHPSASRCFAWSHPTKGSEVKVYAVLAIPPVSTAVDAVRAAIVADARKGGG